LQQIIELVNGTNILEVFEKIDKIDIKAPIISQLKKEYIYGNKGFDFYNRLKMAIRDELDER
jgi:hypothetical protein